MILRGCDLFYYTLTWECIITLCGVLVVRGITRKLFGISVPLLGFVLTAIAAWHAWDEYIVHESNSNLPLDFEEKVVLITGGNAGIGYEVAKVLVSYRATVILGCRNMERCNKAADSLSKLKIHKDFDPKQQLPVIRPKPFLVDLSSLASVRYFVNNAGFVDMPEGAKTDMGVEL